MRAPFQILAIPYVIKNNSPLYCVFHRSDFDQWQFISGGGEDNETPIQAVKREIFEESGINAEKIMKLTSMCYIPTDIFLKHYLCNWAEDTYVIPEYTFAFNCEADIKLSNEHTEYIWLTYEEAKAKLKWDSNRTALYELNCRLLAGISGETRDFPHFSF